MTASEPRGGESMTVPEFAALCRERCKRSVNGGGAEPCGTVVGEGEDVAFMFCGNHMIALLGGGTDG